MSSVQSEGGGGSYPDTAIDSYLSSLWALKESILSLIQHYHAVLAQKMECDFGNLVACDTEAFRNQLNAVFALLNDTEVHLNGLEAWAGLPPECFSPPSSASFGPNFDSDQVSLEAQTLVKLVNRLQHGLRAMVNKQTSSVTLNPSEGILTSVESQPTPPNISIGQLPKVPSSTAIRHPQPAIYSTGPTSGIQSTHPVISPFLLEGGSHHGSEDVHAYPTAGRYPFTPSSSLSCSTTVRSPVVDRRPVEIVESCTLLPNSNRLVSLPQSSTSLFGLCSPSMNVEISSQSPGTGITGSTSSRSGSHFTPGRNESSL